MSKKKTSQEARSYQEHYELLVEPTVIVTRHPDRQRIDLRKLSLEQADRIYASEGQQVLRKKGGEEGKNPSESAE